MVDFPQYSGPMVDWPQVQAVGGAKATLAVLHRRFTLALATNAQASTAAQIGAALERVHLAGYIDRIYCFQDIGCTKASPEFYAYILHDLHLQPGQALMVGDDFTADVLGANRLGIPAVWLNTLTPEEHNTPLHRTIHHLSELPPLLGLL